MGGEFFSELHEGAATAMLVIAGVHVAGVVVASVLHRENLVASMLNGMKRGARADSIGAPWRVAGALLLAGVVSFWVLALRGDFPAVYAPEAAAQNQGAQPVSHARHGGDD
jgi:H+/Cl- antiporter ClcA